MNELRPQLREAELRLLAIGMAASILPIATGLPVWVLLFSLLFTLWRLIPGWYGRQRAPAAFLRLPLGLACFLGIWLEYGSFNGVEPGSALLCLMLGLKMLESWKARDGLILAMLSYILLLAVFLNNQDLPVAVWLSAVCCFQTAVLLRMSRISDPGPLRPSLLMAGRLLLQALPIALIMFALFPRVPGPLWGTPTPEPRAITGLSDRMSPGSISQLAQSNELAFRVSFPDGREPAPAQRYWRGPVFHQFDGQEWREGGLPDYDFTLIPLGEAITQEITLEAHGQRWIMALDMPGGDLPRDVRQLEDGRLESEDRISERMRYTVSSWPSYNLDPALSERWQEELTRIPENSNPETQALGRRWAEEHGDTADVLIERALDYFGQEAFYYTLEPPRLGRHAMDEFLFDSRRGFCEHYAAAFTLLMRAAGHPARVVTGYLGAEYNPLAGHYRVRQSNAHAWSEVWIEGEGWRRIDPTGAIDPSRVETQLALGSDDDEGDWEGGLSLEYLQLQLEMFWDTVQARWDGWFLAYGPERQQEFLERLGLPGKDAMRLALIMTALIGLSLILLWLGLWFRQRPPRPDDPVERAWLLFQRRMARAGFPRQDHEGPESWQSRLEQEAPAVAAATKGLMERFRKARYAGNDRQGEGIRDGVKRLRPGVIRRLARE
jgi:protein-glutamine gamma-glutamyltransferase